MAWVSDCVGRTCGRHSGQRTADACDVGAVLTRLNAIEHDANRLAVFSDRCYAVSQLESVLKCVNLCYYGRALRNGLHYCTFGIVGC